ncbi:MAG: acetoin dehydrogenase dihydrolipoyllysine-residue acetyltransferase subunit [Rhizobiales bacterium]|nr:acetoin dehydrogenase dihydrolipoyllysine-residue acetyltransferase subunit [Hyphomicrobiales bacterium]MBI3671951.1 acetoin dehydrogenase dihydrolipoyllysine-residue acetyltransferase subunit [Hyphomicrobiales bacterium]
MSASRIVPIVMPKWGLSMKEGKVTGWLLEDGSPINIGDAILEVETDKIAGAVEASEPGVLRRRVGTPDTVYPVKALLGVIAEAAVPDAEIDAYVASYVMPAADEGEEDQAAKYEFADTPTGTLRYARRGGAGDNLILLHGFGGDLDNFLFNIDALGETATVYALDLPGHGQSIKNVAKPDLASLTAALAGFMDKLGLKDAHLVGHSLGGAIAMRMAAEAPGRVKSLTLICSAGLGSEIGSYVDDFVAAQGRKDLKPVLETLFADKSQVSRQLVDDVLKYKRLDGVDAFLKALAQAVFGGRKQQDFPAAQLAGKAPPALVIWGREDAVIPAAHAGNLPGATVKVIDGAGHMVFMEKAGEVNALIKAHIARS